MPDATEADEEALQGGFVRAVELPGQDLPGNVEPRRTIGGQVSGPGFKEAQKLAFVFA
jgi:hypothetical protein